MPMDNNRQLEIRLNELAKRAAYGSVPVYTKFLEPSAFSAALRAAADNGIQCRLFGGFEDAERCIAGYGYPEDSFDYPIACLEAVWNTQYATCGHRDLLGAMMGLGVVREAFGDILVDEGKAYLFVTEDIAPYVTANLESAGRARLKIRQIPLAEARIPAPKGRISRITAASERIDCVIAEAYNLSRSEVKKLIQCGDVKRNHIEEMRPDINVFEGDILSVRGYGRVRVLSIDGETRKGRMAMQVFVYGK